MAEPEPEPEPRAEPQPVPEPDAPPADSTTVREETDPPRFMTPDEEAATLALHAPPVGQPWIPRRRSLDDDELVDVLDAAGDQPGGTLSAMDALENEMRLRGEEKQEYREWEDSMLAVGTPEALAAVAQVRPNFTNIQVPVGLEPTPTSAIPVQSPAAETPAAESPAAESPAAESPAAETPAAETPAAPSALGHAIFDEPDHSRSTITGQNDIVAALVSEAATEAAVEAAQQSTPAFDSIFEAHVFAPPAEAAGADNTDAAAPEFAGPELAVPEPAVSEQAAPEPRAPEPDAPVQPAPFNWADPQSSLLTGSTPVEAAPNFDELLSGGSDEAPNDRAQADAPSTVDDIAAFFAETGSIPVETPPASVDAVAPETVVAPVTAVAPETAVAPAPTSRREARLAPEPAAESAPLFAIEQTGLAPTPEQYRIGRASRLFWLWFAANSSVVSIAFGAMVFSLGMSLRQSIVAVLAGVALSFIPLGLGTLAGKRSGQPTVVVSRAPFGLAGNILPSVLALVSRVFWGGVLLWLFASSIASVLVSNGADGGLGYESLVFLWLVVGAIVAALVGFFGYSMLARFQLVVSIVSGVLIVGFVALTAGRVEVQAALTVDDGPWVVVITGTVLVFSFVGLVWANSSSDLARYQRPGSLGSTSMLWATFGTAVPTFLLIAYGALLAASDPELASGLVSEPIGTLAEILPSWYPLPLIVTTALSLLSGVMVIVYSGGFALQAVGLRLERHWSTVVVGALLLVLAAVFSLLAVDLTEVFRDLATTLAVPVAAWAGIFAADTMIRTRRFHTRSLLVPGGIYPSVNWVNLGALLVIALVGYGLTTATIGLLSWQGYLFQLGGVPLDGALAGSDLGVLVALLLGILTPIVSGIPAIRRQETAAV